MIRSTTFFLTELTLIFMIDTFVRRAVDASILLCNISVGLLAGTSRRQSHGLPCCQLEGGHTLFSWVLTCLVPPGQPGLPVLLCPAAETRGRLFRLG